MIYIVVSKEESYLNAATLLLEAVTSLKEEARIIYIEEILNLISILKKDGIFFFLTNHESIGQLVNILRTDAHKIVNQYFLLGDRKKSNVQQRIQEAGITTPRRYHQFQETPFPYFIKQEQHGKKVEFVESKIQFDSIFTKIYHGKEWYIEEAVGNKKQIKKYYWIHGQYVEKDNERLNHNLQKIFNTIGNVLNLDVFSADFIESDGKYYCIDVNPAPGFYGSTHARTLFARWLCKQKTG